VCFYEEAVRTGGNGSFCDRANELWIAAGDPAGLVGLLEGVRAIHDDGCAMFLHPGDVAVVDYQVLVAEGGASFGEDDLIVPSLFYLIDGELHRWSAEELSFLYVDDLSGLRGCDEQVGLAAEKGRDLEDIDAFCGGCGFVVGVDVGGSGYLVGNAYFLYEVQAAVVADAGEGARAGAVGFAVRGLKYIWDTEVAADVGYPVRHFHNELFAFDDAGAGDEEEIFPVVGLIME